MSHLSKRLGEIRVWVDQQTTIDPHPFFDCGDTGLDVQSNVLFADNYYQFADYVLFGYAVVGAYNLDITERIRWDVDYCDTRDKAGEHELTHTYYHYTIKNSCAEGIEIPDFWYSPPFPDRTRTGFYFTPTGGGDRWATSSEQNRGSAPYFGLHYQLRGSQVENRVPVSYMSHDWSNATLKPLTNYNVKVGESVNFTYYYLNAGGAGGSRGTIEFFLDYDRDPLNGNYRQIGTASAPESTQSILTETFNLWKPTATDATTHGGELYVQIKATNPSGNVRYDYLLKPIYISPATQLPSDLVVENLSVTPGSGEPGSNATVAFRIRNNGDIAYPSLTNIRLSASSSNVTVNDTLLASIEIPQIAKGATYQVSQNVVIPGVGASGIYYVWVILDVNNEANQGSNTSNDKANQPFVVTVPPPPSAIGDFVQVYNTGTSGLKVRSPNACDSPLIGQNRFDGATGKVIDGPQTCNIGGSNYAMWKIQWSDCLVGWSAQNWLKKIPFATISCGTTYTIIRLEGDLNFGAVEVGGSVQKLMTIYNDGNSTLTVSSISYPPGFSGNWSGTIAAGSSRQVTVTFAPSEAKAYSGNVTVNSDATSGINTRPVSGTGTFTSTRILRLVGDLNFGEIQVGGSDNRPMTIYNDGNSTLTVNSIGYQEGFSGDWHGSIAAGSSKQVTVNFSPTTTKAYSGNVIVYSDASGANTLPASGTGIIAQTRTIRLMGDLNFGEVQVGHSASRTMTIFNNGNLTLTVNSISYPPGFSGAWSGTIEGNSSHTVPVTFLPTEEKTYSGNVVVNSNATSGTNTLPVSGTGTIKSIFTLTVASSSPDSGVTITVSPNDNNGQGSGTTQSTRTYNTDTTVTLTAPPTAGGKDFQKWQRNGVDWTTSQTAYVTMDTDYIMTAVYPTPVYTIGVGSQPHGVGVNPQTNRIYVANKASNYVSVIDGENDQVVAKVDVGGEPFDVGVNPTTNRIYVSNLIGNSVSVIDGMFNQVVATVENVLSPIGIGVNPTTNRIYVTNFNSNTVSVINGENNTVVTTVGVGVSPVGIGVNPQTNRIYVANANGGTVSVINGANNQVVATVLAGNTPAFVGVNSQTNRIYVSDPNNNTVIVINGDTNKVIATVGVGELPFGIGVNPQTNRIYVANKGYSSSSVSVIDGAINQVLVTVGVQDGTTPRGVGVNPKTNRVYVSNQGGNMVSVIDWQLPPPVVSTFQINDGASEAASRTVTLNNTTTGIPTHYMASESGGFTGAIWQTYAASPSFPLSAGDGVKTVYFKVKDANGESAVVNDVITLKELPAVSAFQINNGASDTSIRTVTLNNTTTSIPTHYMASESPGFADALWLTYTASPSFTLSTGDGEKTVYFKVKNANGESLVVNDSITLKELPVVSLFQINNGTAETTSRTVTLNNTATGGPTHYMASESASFTDATWQPYAAAPFFTLSAGDGVKTVYFKVKNANGEPAMVNDSITFKELPVVVVFLINNGADETTSPVVMLNSTAAGSPTHYMASESLNFTNATWQPYAAAPFFTLSAGDGVKTVYFKVKNGNGESAVANDDITLKEIPVVSTFQINNGAAETTSRMVTLNNTATGSPTHYMASESVSFADATWLTYAVAPGFTLSAGDGVKTVYFKAKNANGESNVLSDAITLKDNLPAVTSFQINNGAADTTSRKVTLNSEVTGSPKRYMASESATFVSAKWKKYKKAIKFTLSASLEVKTVYFKVKSATGESSAVNDTITLKKALMATVADAGVDQLARKGSVITLDGSRSYSTEENVPLTYQWSFVSLSSGMESLLSDFKSVSPTFTLKRQGRCEIQLIVKDSLGAASEPDTVVISTQDTTPVAHTGSDQSIHKVGTRVMLNGAQSYDPDGDVLAYQWAFISRPAESTASLEDADTVRSAFVADAPGEYVIQLTVTDSHTQSASDTVTVSFGNVRPVANAGKSLAVKVGDTITLAGDGMDANGDALRYQWMLSSLPGGSLSEMADSSARVTTFTPDRAGTYVAQLVVSDGELDSEPCAIQIQAFTTQTKTITALQEMETRIAELDNSAFKNGDMQLMLLNKLNAVIANVEAGKHADAANQLRNDILPKIGSAGNTEGDSAWIINRSSQNVWYQEAQDVVRVLETVN